MDKEFDIYKGDDIFNKSVVGETSNGKTIVTLAGLEPSTTYDNISIAYAGSSSRSSVPSFTTAAAPSTATETQTQTKKPVTATATETQTQTKKPVTTTTTETQTQTQAK